MGTRKLRKSKATRRQTTTTVAEVHREDDLCSVEPSDSMEITHLEANLETTGEVQQATTNAPQRSPATVASSPELGPAAPRSPAKCPLEASLEVVEDVDAYRAQHLSRDWDQADDMMAVDTGRDEARVAGAHPPRLHPQRRIASVTNGAQRGALQASEVSTNVQNVQRQSSSASAKEMEQQIACAAGLEDAELLDSDDEISFYPRRQQLHSSRVDNLPLPTWQEITDKIDSASMRMYEAIDKAIEVQSARTNEAMERALADNSTRTDEAIANAVTRQSALTNQTLIAQVSQMRQAVSEQLREVVSVQNAEIQKILATQNSEQTNLIANLLQSLGQRPAELQDPMVVKSPPATREDRAAAPIVLTTAKSCLRNAPSPLIPSGGTTAPTDGGLSVNFETVNATLTSASDETDNSDSNQQSQRKRKSAKTRNKVSTKTSEVHHSSDDDNSGQSSGDHRRRCTKRGIGRHIVSDDSDSETPQTSRSSRRPTKNLQKGESRKHRHGALKFSEASNTSPRRQCEDSPRPPRARISYKDDSKLRRRREESVDFDSESRRSHQLSHERNKRKMIQLSQYDGSTPIEAFLAKFETAAEYNGWNKADKTAHLRNLLTGKAELLLWTLDRPVYEDIITRLKRRFGSEEQQQLFLCELKARRRHESESIQELSQDVERLTYLAYPSTDPTTRNVLAREAFIEALNCRALEMKVREKDPRTLEEALRVAMRLETLYQTSMKRKEDPKPRQARQVTSVKEVQVEGQPPKGRRDDGRKQANSNGHKNDSESLEAQITKVVQRQLKQVSLQSLPRQRLSAPAEQMPVIPSPRPSSEFVGTCQYGDFQPMTQQQQQPAPPMSAMQSPSLRCFSCGGIGHFARTCPYQRNPPLDQRCRQNQLPERQGQDVPRADNVPAQTRMVEPNNPSASKVYLRLRIRGKRQQCLLDTGSDISLIPSRIVEKQQLQKTSQSVLAANGTRIPIKGWATVQGQIGDIPVGISGLVSDHIREVMLGFDWLKNNRVHWNFVDGEVVVAGQHFKLETRNMERCWSRRVILSEEVIVPPLSELDVKTAVVFGEVSSEAESTPKTWSTQPAEVKAGLLVARTLLPNRATDLPVRLLNVTNSPVSVTRNTVLSDLEPVEPVVMNSTNEVVSNGVDVTNSVSPETVDVIEEMMSRVDTTTPDPFKQQLRQLLDKYSAVFSRDELDLGWTNLVEHNIDVGDSKPFRQPLRRYAPIQQRAIDKHLGDMLQQGVIEPASSEWASNIVLVKKKDGTYRCCVDYRQLNELTKKDAYPVPRQDDCIEALNGSCWFSSIDLRCGYHQCSLKEEDSDKTAFITRRGMYKFRTMPFGLCNAVATFQRLMDLVLSGLNLNICLTYLDDVVVFARTPEEHLVRLEQVFKRFQSANLKLKPSKCWLMQTEITFLGHVVNKEGVATDPEKIRLVQEWPEPKNVKELRGFLGLTGYYRKFVESYSRIAAPLNQLLKKNRSFIWTEECKQAFDQLKQVLLSPPILVLPGEEDTFILDTDACDVSIGAVLSVIKDGKERIVAFAGRTLNKNERNYCVTRKELLAIVYFVKYFRQYLLSKPFTIRTDHAPLSWLKRMPDPVGQNARWLEQLGEYDYQVEHRKGKSHLNADSVSRHPCLNRPSCTACHPCSEEDINVRTVQLLTDTDNLTPEQHLNSEKDGSADQSRSSSPSVSSRDKEVTVPEDEEHRNPPASEQGVLKWTGEEISAAQKRDMDIGFIVQLLSTNVTKPEWRVVELQSAEVKTLWHEWERLTIVRGILYRRWTSLQEATDHLQIVMPREYRTEVIQLAHTGMTGGHLGRTKTEEQVRQRAYWPNWRNQVASEVKSCKECVTYHRGKAPRQTLLQPFSGGEPFEIIAIDITGKHPKSMRGNEYIITVTDLFSKWSEAFPVRTHKAPVVAKVLLDQFICRFGCPKRCLSDQGAEFQSELFHELCKRLGIEKIRTSPYKPTTNGCVERFHRTLNSMLAKVVQANQKDWDDCLPSVMAAYRAAKHSATGFSPNALVFGKENRAPIDLVLGGIVSEEEHHDSHDEYVKRIQARHRQSYALARDHLRAAAERRKDDYDVKVKEVKFNVGDWVWYYYPRRYTQRSPKWSKNYDGPFLIVRIIAPSDYVIQRTKQSRPQVVHQDKLKQCYGQTPKSWLQAETDVVQPTSPTSTNSPEPEKSASESSTKPRQRRTVSQKMPEVIFDSYEEDSSAVRKTPRRRQLPVRFLDYHL